MARAVSDGDVFRRVVRMYWREECRTMRLMAAVLGENAGAVKFAGKRRRFTYGQAMMYTYWMEQSS